MTYWLVSGSHFMATFKHVLLLLRLFETKVTSSVCCIACRIIISLIILIFWFSSMAMHSENESWKVLWKYDIIFWCSYFILELTLKSSWVKPSQHNPIIRNFPLLLKSSQSCFLSEVWIPMQAIAPERLTLEGIRVPLCKCPQIVNKNFGVHATQSLNYTLSHIPFRSLCSSNSQIFSL